MISNTELYDSKKIVNQFGTTEAEIDVNTADTLQIKATNIELTGTLTNNGSPISGGGSTPNDGRLTIKMNGEIQDNAFSANTASDVDVQLYNVMRGYRNTTSTSGTVLPNYFYDYAVSGGVTAITIKEGSGFLTNGYLNEFFCKFKAQTSSVTISSYDNRNIEWSTEGEQANNLTAGDDYFMDVIAYVSSGTYYYYGTIKKFKAN